MRPTGGNLRPLDERAAQMNGIMPAQPSAWVKFWTTRTAEQIRLLCFPYAGGSVSIYRHWTDLPPEIGVCAVQLPGRDERFRERAFTRVDKLCDALVPALGCYLDMPFAMFGHSMGAIIAYESARRLEARGQVPVRLFASGHRAPHLPLRRKRAFDLSNQAFRERLRELNGTPEDVLRNPDLMELVLPRLRDDFELSETYERQQARLICPITALGGSEDREVSRSDLEGWRLVTTADFDVKMFAGDHFYLDKQGPALHRHVAERLLVDAGTSRWGQG
jgi:medium-chain acyl-[acyl-carrier-protein] hydrolase